jgi:hypothetical protein
LDERSARRKAATYEQNKGRQLMHQMGFEPTISVTERAKTCRALEHAVTMICCKTKLCFKNFMPVGFEIEYALYRTESPPLECIYCMHFVQRTRSKTSRG